jgi:hypothetical protein
MKCRYADLDSPSPGDLSLNVNLDCTANTAFDDSVAVNVVLPPKGPSPTPVLDKRLLLHIGKQNRRIDNIQKGLSLRLTLDPDTPFLAGLIDANSPWFDLIDCTASIIFVIIDVLTKATLNKKAFANVLWKVFGKFGVQLARYISLIVKALNGTVSALMSACLDLMTFFHESGLFKQLLECFAL